MTSTSVSPPPIAAGLAVVQGFERRGRGTEDNVAAADVSEHDRGVAAVVPRSGRVLLVGGVMFLVDYYESEVMVRQKQG